MHLIEKYALSTGSRIGKPFIVKKFFPVPFDKYITIQNSSGMPAKCYDYFQEVINFLLPILEKHGIGVVQIGGKEDMAINGCHHTQGVTNINQTAYVLSNSSLHLGNDSFAIHMCSAFQVPIVGLYSITLPDIAGPYFNKNYSTCLYPDNEKPSFNPNEQPKRINNIKIEDVVNACLKKLSIDIESINLKTFHIGSRYKEIIVESIPNQVISTDFFTGAVLNLRCDFIDNIDINIVYNNIAIRKCSIITDKPFDLSFVPHVKDNLELLIYDITKSLDMDFIKNLHSLNIKYVCVFNKTDENQNDIINNYKLDLIDYCSIQEFKLVPQDAPTIFPIGMKFISNRILLSNGIAYSSRAAQIENIPVDVSNGLVTSLDSIKNKEKFLEDIDYCFVYSE
jgi:hypothetical protein